MPRKTKSNITQQKWGENYANGRTYAEVISFWGILCSFFVTQESGKTTLRRHSLYLS